MYISIYIYIYISPILTRGALISRIPSNMTEPASLKILQVQSPGLTRSSYIQRQSAKIACTQPVWLYAFSPSQRASPLLFGRLPGHSHHPWQPAPLLLAKAGKVVALWMHLSSGMEALPVLPV